MKKLFIEAIRKDRLSDNQLKILDTLPGKKIALLYSIQYKEHAKQIKQYLGKKIIEFKQVLGCSNFKSDQADIILLVGSGKFHALLNSLSADSPIYIYNIGVLEKISEQELEKLKKKKKAALTKFYAADEIGILVSTKPGQYHYDKALDLKKKLEADGKKAFIFLADNINIAELENFSCQSWVNTACPGLALDSSKIVNIEEL